MDTEPTPAWKEDCPSRLLKGQQHEKTSRPTVGRNIAGGCIRLRSPHDLRIRHPHLRIVLGDREQQTDWVIDQQRHQLGQIVASKACLCWWPHERRLRDAAGCAGLMHAKAAVADS